MGKNKRAVKKQIEQVAASVVKEKLPNEAQKRTPSLELQLTPIKFYKDGSGDLQSTQDSRFMKEGFRGLVGVKDDELSKQILTSGTIALSQCGKEDHILNITLQSLTDAQPADAMEARLATQANVVFTQAMFQMAKAQQTGELSHCESYMNLSIKLLRLHNETVEALNRYRRGGIQQVIVQHVTADRAIVNQFNGVNS